MKPMLAKPYDTQPVQGWLMSEKIDGCRAIWNGTELMSRNGNKFFAPSWFTEQLPAGVMLDGELCVGRKAFQRGVSIVRKKKPVDAEWQEVRYFVFDAPEYRGGFETRIDFCSEILSGCQVAEVVKQTVCRGHIHLQKFFSDLIEQGAEGIMIRRPGSAYEQKRSGSLLKFKPFDSDEAEVLGHQPGEGKHIGRLGALVCRWGSVVFNLGTGLSDDSRQLPPRIGAKVSFMFFGLTDGGVPRFPVFLTERDYE